MKQQGSPDEELLRVFREQGASMMESVKLIRQLKAASLGEAQDIVHFSATWADRKEDQERLAGDFSEALEWLGQEDHGGDDDRSSSGD
jgi:hypothetical protein